MLSCKEVYYLIWSGKKLSLKERVSLSLHLFICPNCQHSKGEFEKLNELAKDAVSKRCDGHDTSKLEEDILKELKKRV